MNKHETFNFFDEISQLAQVIETEITDLRPSKANRCYDDNHENQGVACQDHFHSI